MLRLIAAGIAFSCLVLSLGGCSAESKSESCTYNGQQIPCDQMPDAQGKVHGLPPPIEDKAFTCGSQSCQSGANYCQEFGRLNMGNGPVKIFSSSCEPKPAACNDCDCLEKYVREHSCVGYDSTMCTSSNSQITMSCLN